MLIRCPLDRDVRGLNKRGFELRPRLGNVRFRSSGYFEAIDGELEAISVSLDGRGAN